jgi:hypothetical protein
LQSIPKIHGRSYLPIFVLASATLSYQILITRFFSVMLYYHFAFAAISLAMLGLTRGAMEVYGKPARYGAERVGVEFARHASWFALGSVGAMVGLLCLPTLVPAAAVPVVLAVAIIAFIWPFTEGGVCITLLLTRLPYSGGWLYAADLLGAAVRCPQRDLPAAVDRSRECRYGSQPSLRRGLDRYQVTATRSVAFA